jgi:hypothetical protein
MFHFTINTFVFFILSAFLSKAAQDIDESQQINLFDKQKHKFYRLILPSSTCVELSANGQQKTRTIQFENVKLDDFPPELASNYFQTSSHQFLITIQGTGQTYQFNTLNNQLTRIDKTYFRGYNFQPIQFIRQDTLISFGGTGFWRNHNIATFFHKPLYEWELYGNISDDGPKAVSSQFGGYSTREDLIYCMEFPALYKAENDLIYPFYSFDFKKKKWNELGTIDFNRIELNGFNKFASQWIEPYFFSHEISLGEYIDPIENKIYRYNGKNIAFFHLSTQVYIKGKYIYSFLRTYNRNKFDFKLDSMSIDQLKKNSLVIGHFYTPKIWYNQIEWDKFGYGVILLVIFGLIASIIRLSRHKYQQEIQSWSQLPEQGELFLHHLCAQPDHTCSTEKLNEILQCEGKTIESQRQSRSKFISSINLFFERNYGCQEAIQRLQAEGDKRFVNYMISQEAVDIFTKKI